MIGNNNLTGMLSAFPKSQIKYNPLKSESKHLIPAQFWKKKLFAPNVVTGLG